VRLAPQDEEYYARTLQLFALGWQDGRLRFGPEGELRPTAAACAGGHT
jgi:endo-1,4-beta-D-glucanase Y